MNQETEDDQTDAAARIVNHALELAEASSWEAVRLHQVAAAAGLSLDDVRHHFREKDEIIDAWFDRADQAMLAAATDAELGELPVRQRLERLMLAWLEALAPHRQVTRQMIQAKAEIGHVHIQVPAVMRISRTVQWLREAAHQDATHLRRAVEETVLTSIYLATFVHWLWDHSEDYQRTRRLLSGLLRAAERAAQGLAYLPLPRGSGGATWTP